MEQKWLEFCFVLIYCDGSNALSGNRYRVPVASALGSRGQGWAVAYHGLRIDKGHMEMVHLNRGEGRTSKSRQEGQGNGAR